MKKIILSLSIIAIVAIVVVGATTAFFSDTETSTGNVFTAGSLDLKVDSTCHYWQDDVDVGCKNGGTPFGTWIETDLTLDHKFFNFGDVKPGDRGENTISLRPVDNDAYICAYITNLTNNDNGITEPESYVDSSDGVGNGELQNNIHLKIWKDNYVGNGIQACDNVWQNGEVVLVDDTVIDNNYGGWLLGEVEGDTTSCIGVAWNVPIGVGNIIQTDSVSADISFYAEQVRNNSNFTCPDLQVERPRVGANLGNYAQPTGNDCNITVSSGNSIQDGINRASSGQTVCVEAGTYNQDVVIDKSLTLSGNGADTTSTINGVSTAYVGAVTVANGVTNVTIEGFEINGAGQAAVYLIGNNSGITVRSNKLVSPTNGTQKNAFLSGGLQTNNTITNNEFVGTGISTGQLAYVNGRASLNVASDNVDFTYNTFSGTIASGGIVLGNEAGNSEVTRNVFESSLTSTYTIMEAWQDGIIVNENNFNGVGGVKVKRSSNGSTGTATTNAENNWWGDTDPSDNIAGSVDYTPSELSAFPE